MRLRFLFAGALAFACVSFAACTTSPSYTPTPTPPLPTPAPTIHLAGNQTQTFTYYYGFSKGKVQPPLVVKTSVKQQINTFATTPPSGISASATTDAQVSETDATSLQTNKSVTDNYVSTSGTSVYAYGAVTGIFAPAGGQSSTTTTVYGSPQQISAAAGTTWRNSPKATVDEMYSDGHYEDRSIASDGTYDETGTTYNVNQTLAKIKLSEQSTGAGFYRGPFEGTPSNTSFNFAAPSGSPSTIDITLFLNKNTYPEATIPSWFGEPPALYVDRIATTTATTPSACDARAGISATLDHRFRRTIDTIVGYVDNYDVKTYYTAEGPVCIVLDDFIDNYYDWQGDTPYFVLFSGNAKPIGTINTVETLLASSGSSSSSSARRAHFAATAATPVSAVAALAAEAHFAAQIEALHARLRKTMFQHIARFHGGAR
ncbi:MAG TPA: hypothetical protein VMF61_03075 [Candidatus Acidoferrales bacterium]|nr:hypothetical protein [Candidatus Acidoferrales bacterium]